MPLKPSHDPVPPRARKPSQFAPPFLLLPWAYSMRPRRPSHLVVSSRAPGHPPLFHHILRHSPPQPPASEDGDFKSNFGLADLGGIIKSMENSNLLLNQARLQEIEEVNIILDQKEALQKAVNILEMKLSKTFAPEGNINTESPNANVEKFRKKVSLEVHYLEGVLCILVSLLVMELKVLKEATEGGCTVS
ncbi:uncharacterized protein LOC112271082 [Brachypodium distachyon]|uniref:uncharacterized protein LOC112271082 n=1 Tax=Brachypodium distachyon TaxID=15368 RepID=UPI000D0E0D42|nr:uncharacterized protein LOC112271082 [Brachypodium distachyon]|eukprot:XP_024315783.1 uncharacterized protein LOC112271082 [Brachypodium distachyon]